MNTQQAQAMATAIMRQTLGDALAAFVERRDRRRPWSWLEEQLEPIRARGVADIMALCEQCKGEWDG